MINNLAVKECLIHLVEESTIHGLPRIFKSEIRIVKLLWLICFLGSAGYCVYMTLGSIFNYLDYEVITSIESIRQVPSLLPEITLCNYNQYQNPNTYSYINQIDSNLIVMNNFHRNFFIRNQLLAENDSFKKSLSHDLSELLLECRLNDENCYADDFIWTYHPLYGNCYRFNSGKNKTSFDVEIKGVSRAGPNNGLVLKLFVGNPNNSLYFIEKTGFHLMINNQSYKLNVDDGYDIATGTFTSVSLIRNFYKKLSNPYNDCIKEISPLKKIDENFYKAFVSQNKTYRQIDCYNLCYQSLVISGCSCFLYSLDRLNGERPCLNSTQVVCSLKVWGEFLTIRAEECNTKCPQECDSMNFQIGMTFADFPSLKYSETLMVNPKITSKLSNITYETLKRSVLGLAIYYDQLIYSELSQIPKIEIVDLVSNIGGLFGLFLGLSFLSFVELIEVFLVLINILFKYSKNQVQEIKN